MANVFRHLLRLKEIKSSGPTFEKEDCFGGDRDVVWLSIRATHAILAKYKVESSERISADLS